MMAFWVLLSSLGFARQNPKFDSKKTATWQHFGAFGAAPSTWGFVWGMELRDLNHWSFFWGGATRSLLGRSYVGDVVWHNLWDVYWCVPCFCSIRFNGVSLMSSMFSFFLFFSGVFIRGFIVKGPDVEIAKLVVVASQSALPEAEVLDTIYQYADTPTARTAHDFRVASALGGDALIKALEKMEEMPEAEKRESRCDPGWRWFWKIEMEERNWMVLFDIRCVSKVDILGHEHWHSRKKEDDVFIQTHAIWSMICCLITSWLQRICRIQSAPPFFDFDCIQNFKILNINFHPLDLSAVVTCKTQRLGFGMSTSKRLLRCGTFQSLKVEIFEFQTTADIMMSSRW